MTLLALLPLLLLLRAVSWSGCLVHILGYCLYSWADGVCVAIEQRFQK